MNKHNTLTFQYTVASETRDKEALNRHQSEYNRQEKLYAVEEIAKRERKREGKYTQYTDS